MSTAAKVALATTAGAVAATAAGLATSKQGRKLRQRVTRKIHELVDAGAISLRNSKIRDVVQEFESVLGGMLAGRGRGRDESSGGRGAGMSESRMGGRFASERMSRRGRRLSQY